MSKRKAIPPEIESKVLLESARRCALCYGLNGDLSRKQGQIAHVDQDPSNSDEANLVYLCLDQHNEYDSTTSQSKGITDRELLEYKRRLIGAITNGEHRTEPSDVNNEATLKHRRSQMLRWRTVVNEEFQQNTFKGTLVYTELRPHLGAKTIEWIEGGHNRTLIVQGSVGDPVKRMVLDDITTLEIKWNLI